MSILSELQSKKLGLLELISLGFNLYIKKNRLFLGLFLIYLPFSIILTVLSYYLLLYGYILYLWVLISIFYIFVYSIYSATLCILTESCVLQENIQPKAVVKWVLSHILPLIGLEIRFFITSYLLFLLLFVPGIIYFINNDFSFHAFILRGQRGKAAFLYSRTLVKGNWWKAFFFALLTYLISGGLQAIFYKIFNITVANSSILITVISTALIQLILLGFGICKVLFFLNLEFQKQ
ncbi:hypothetical protein [Nostoc sp. FACHB-133]|uniref:hypothetical protein n=1 Tax=Nostoc sp. FACHB-133 TaxID=2692835 RepID=UPI0016892ED9|nr:hypothetical protein [Nostoc sp. FACHB-133]MBD2525180.1 hypothetical protein [Nostoc sp. FACHB-133]